MILKIKFPKLGNAEYAKHSQRFFKFGEGNYGYGDLFLGIRVPIIKKIAKENSNLFKAEKASSGQNLKF